MFILRISYHLQIVFLDFECTSFTILSLEESLLPLESKESTCFNYTVRYLKTLIAGIHRHICGKKKVKTDWGTCQSINIKE